MKTLVFKGYITAGVGRHVELGIPGRGKLPEAPADWPEKLQPGSLNIRVDHKGYPPELTTCDPFLGIKTLDRKLFAPAFLIPQNKMQNNKLKPCAEMPDQGTAQVWRALLHTGQGSSTYAVWVLRRFGSNVGEQLELVSDVHLRKTLSLADGMATTVELQYEET